MITDNKPAPFPATFWTANTIELFERAAYYAMASFVVIYLGQLGFGNYWPSIINAFLWGLIYFLQIPSGTIADRIGFKRALLIAFAISSLGYFAMGFPVWFGSQELLAVPSSEFAATQTSILPICLGVFLIGVGGSFVKPTAAATVHKTSGARRTLGFAIFFLVIGTGNLIGRMVSFVVRRSEGFDLSSIFLVSFLASLLAIFFVIFFFKDPDIGKDTTDNRKTKSLKAVIADMVIVLKNLKFSLFLLITCGFYMFHAQLYNLFPLYTKKTIELTPAMDIYTAANPIIIVTCQLLITRFFGKLSSALNVLIGLVLAALAMLVNIIPLYISGGVTPIIGNIIPLGSMFIVFAVIIIALGEVFTSAKLFEYTASFAPKGQEALYQGYSNLPIAIGSIVGGFTGAWVFNEIMCKNAVELSSRLLQLDIKQATLGWLVLAASGLFFATSMYMYLRWISREAK